MVMVGREIEKMSIQLYNSFLVLVHLFLPSSIHSLQFNHKDHHFISRMSLALLATAYPLQYSLQLHLVCLPFNKHHICTSSCQFIHLLGQLVLGHRYLQQKMLLLVLQVLPNICLKLYHSQQLQLLLKLCLVVFSCLGDQVR